MRRPDDEPDPSAPPPSPARPSPHDWSRIESLYDRLRGLEGEELDAELDLARRRTPSAARHVERLLAAGREPGAALLSPGGALAADVWDGLAEHVARPAAAAPERRAGERIGAFRIVRELGRGGMGVVYLAERDDPGLRQRVALKVMRAVGDVGDLIERFEQERRILASLDHPNVARFLDAGLSESGEPYLVMDLVEGRPLLEACDEDRLDLRARVELFVTIAEAVQSAHRRLIVHRDLKPSNLLVDRDGRPKLLDFGIAKLLSEEAPRAATGSDGDDPGQAWAPATRTRARFLTPEYAAPEQIRGDPVTVATDVHQLGLLLFELLSGCRARERADSDPATLERAIGEQPLRAPSRALAACSAERRAQIAAARATTPERLRQRLAGDLDTIVLQASAIEPERRYGSAAELAADLERWRDGLPVRARPATVRYRVGKFVRRHRWPVAAAVMLTLSIVAGLAGTLWQASSAATERDRALAAARRAERVAELLVGIFEASDPEIAQGDDVSGRELLDRSRWRIDQELADEPALRAEMRGVLGRVYGGLGRHREARELLERAIADLRSMPQHDAALLATQLDRFAEVLLELDESEAAESALREALALRQDALGGEPAALAESRSRLGHLHHYRNELDEAQRHFEQALELRRSVRPEGAGDDHQAAIAQSLDELGWLLYERRDYDRAEPLLREALATRRRVLGDRHPDVAVSLGRLAAIESVRGRPDAAEALYQESLELTRRVFGDSHPRTLVQQNNLAQMLIRRERPVEAERLLRITEVALAERLGPQHPYRATALMNLGTSLRRQERWDEAIEVLRETVEIRRAIREEPHRATATALYTLGLAHRDVDQLAEAAAALGEALEVFRLVEPADSTYLSNALVNCGDVLVRLGRTAEAEPLILEGLAMREATYGAEHWITVMTRSVLGSLRGAQGRADEARRLLEDSVAVLREQMPGHTATVQAEDRLARWRASSPP